MKTYRLPFPKLVRLLEVDFLKEARPTSTKTWQALDVTERPEMVPHELMNVSFEMEMIEPLGVLQDVVKPNLPWAEDHIQERVSGIPHNPPPSNEWWPYARNGNAEFKADEMFSHTYPERFWPKHAGSWQFRGGSDPQGIRYDYGDLGDVVDLLERDPYTRQAYLPVWFPEDTGAHHGERVPCTLGYQFFIREGHLSIVYYIRSCDFMRHFRDDVYMAIRLAHWVLNQLRHRSEKLQWLKLGTLTMHIGSFHIFAGDIPILQAKSQGRRHETIMDGLG